MTTIGERLIARPPAQVLRWVEDAVGAGASVVRVRRLRGGWSAAVHALDVRAADGAMRRLVLRRYVRADWLAREPDLAEREARVLTLLAGTAVPTPRLVGVDATAERCDVPAVLMTRVRGRVDLAPRDLDRWLARLAEPLPVIHALDVRGTAVPPYAPYYDVAHRSPPPWTRAPAAWAAVIARAGRPAPPAPARLVHRDYHPGNVLWARGRVTAVLDWVNASVGPSGVDVAHCRTNLAVLFGVDAADRFREHYEALPGATRHDPYFDAVSVLDADLASDPEAEDAPDAWTEQGRSDLSHALRRARTDSYVESLARQL
ncbi:MAG: phosphotransferase [Dehalococcoidia bacterium]